MAGAGYKLFNTGDVLTAAQVNTYLQEQTVMVFDDATARTTALSGVLSEGMVSYLKDTNAIEKYTGSAWVSIDTGSSSPLTTKGDLYTYSTTDARLAVGNNGETLVADSSATTGLRWSAGNALGNPILNSAFQVWQRGTSSTDTNGAGKFIADRWQHFSGTTGRTISRQTTSDTTNLPNIQYAIRLQRDSGNSNTTGISLGQNFETVNSIPFAGKTVTYSFYARKGADFSGSFNAKVISGTGTDQNGFYSGYTGQADVISTSPTLTTSWQRFSASGTVATTATELLIFFSSGSFSGTAGAADYIEITGVQIDLGSVALPFRTYAGTLAGELAACQRYYQRTTNTQTYGAIGNGFFLDTTTARILVPLQSAMRIAPTSVDYATVQLLDSTNTPLTVSNLTIPANESSAQIAQVSVTTTGATGGRSALLRTNNSTAGYIGFSAEL